MQTILHTPREGLASVRPGLLCLSLLMLTSCATPQPPAPTPPGTFAWVRFDTAGVRASGVSGFADRARGRDLTIDDPVRIASVSKLFVALGVMRLVEQGRLDLDADVSDWLGWRLRNPAYPQTPITLRLLLSHRSSLQDDAGYIIPLGERLQDAIANPEAFDAAHAPGTYFRYANVGFPVIASVMERATGERFDRLIDRLVMTPLGLGACFNWSGCPERSITRAVVLYDPAGAVLRDDLGGVRPACPVVSAGPSCALDGYALGTNGAIFSPQGGLRISARDLGVVGRMLLRRGQHGSRAFLSRASIDVMERAAWTFDGANGNTGDGFYCSYGLGMQRLPTATPGCTDDLFGDGRRAGGHAGDAYGVRSGLWIDRVRGVGIAYFANGNGPEPAKGRSAYRAVEERLAKRIEAGR